jgi:peroxiredoxin
MTQAEIAGGRLTGPTELPSKGRLLNDFELTTTSDTRVLLSDYRGRANLVLIAADEDEHTTALLSSLAAQYSKIEELQAVVLLVVGKPHQAAASKANGLRLPYLTLIDVNGRVHSDLGAVDANGNPQAAVYITDRFGEVFGIYRLRDGAVLPSVKEIVDWLEFINSQCPECGVPEWPT